MFKRALGLTLIVSLCFLGCTKEPEPEPEPVEQAPPEPTADEIHQELYTAIQALWRPLNNGLPLSPAENDAIIGQFKNTRAKHLQHEHLAEAEQKLRSQVQELIAVGQEGGRWLSVKGGIAVYGVISPDSTRYARLDEYADKILSRPRVRVEGFADVDDDTFILFKITDPNTLAVHTEQARVGERICDGLVEVVEIIGNNQEVRLNYVPIDDDNWITPGPKKRY